MIQKHRMDKICNQLNLKHKQIVITDIRAIKKYW